MEEAPCDLSDVVKSIDDVRTSIDGMDSFCDQAIVKAIDDVRTSIDCIDSFCDQAIVHAIDKVGDVLAETNTFLERIGDALYEANRLKKRKLEELQK